jgi:hypothetical protein
MGMAAREVTKGPGLLLRKAGGLGVKLPHHARGHSTGEFPDPGCDLRDGIRNHHKVFRVG